MRVFLNHAALTVAFLAVSGLLMSGGAQATRVGNACAPSSQTPDTLVWPESTALLAGFSDAASRTLCVQRITPTGEVVGSRSFAGQRVAPKLIGGTAGQSNVWIDDRLITLDSELQDVNRIRLPNGVLDVKSDLSKHSLILFTETYDPHVRTATFVSPPELKRLFTVTLDPNQWARVGFGERAVVAEGVLAPCITTIFRQDHAEGEVQVRAKPKNCFHALGVVNELPLLLSFNREDLLVWHSTGLERFSHMFPKSRESEILDVNGWQFLVRSKRKRNVVQWLLQRPAWKLTVVDFATLPKALSMSSRSEPIGALGPDGHSLAVMRAGTVQTRSVEGLWKKR